MEHVSFWEEEETRCFCKARLFVLWTPRVGAMSRVRKETVKSSVKDTGYRVTVLYHFILSKSISTT